MKFLSLSVSFLLFAMNVSNCLADKSYPKDLDLDAYSSYQMTFKSEDEQTEVEYSEFAEGQKRRLDMETLKPQHGLYSFRTNGSNCFSILTDPNLNEHICTEEGSIERKFQISDKLRSTWASYLQKNLVFVGNKEVDNINCNVWRLIVDDKSVDVYTADDETISANQKLRKMVIQRQHGNRFHTTTYFNFQMEFNKNIDDQTFEVPNDCD